ncbi:MAG: hypothetical protein ABI360_05640 [Allobranchiibius sp.]
MKSALVSFVTDDSVPKLEESHLPMPHIAYGLLALGVFFALLGLLWSFRNTAGRPRPQAGRKSGH